MYETALKPFPLWLVRAQLLEIPDKTNKAKTDKYSLVIAADSQQEAHGIAISRIHKHRKYVLKVGNYHKMEIMSEEIKPTLDQPVLFFCRLGNHETK